MKKIKKKMKSHELSKNPLGGTVLLLQHVRSGEPHPYNHAEQRDSEEEKREVAYADTAGELNHLLSLDVLEAVNTGNTVSNGQHATGLVDVDLSNSTENLLLEDGRDLRASDLG